MDVPYGPGEATDAVTLLAEPAHAHRRAGLNDVVRRQLERPWRIAGAFALLFGLAISVLTPPLTGADESQHFTRAFQLSQGSVLTTKHGDLYGAMLPSSFKAQMKAIALASYYSADRTAFLNLLSQPPPRGPATFVSLGTASAYGPGAYVIYAPVIALGRLVGSSTLLLLYLARIAGVIAYAAVLSLAVRRLPSHRWVLVVAGLIPAALNQASTVSADGITMVMTFLVVAEVLRLTYRPDEHQTRTLVELGIAMGILALAKPPYILLAGLALIPAWRHRGRLAGWLCGLLGANGAIFLGWASYQSSHSLRQDYPSLWLVVPHTQYAFWGLNTPKQTHLVLTQPWVFLAAMGRTFWFQGLTTLQRLFGLLSMYQTPWWIVIVSATLLLLAAMVPDRLDAVALDKLVRILMFLGACVVLLAIFAIAYTDWNHYRAPRIDAVPTRYFLPLIPWLMLPLLPARVRLWGRERSLLFEGVLCISVFALLTTVVFGVWGFHYHWHYPWSPNSTLT